MVEVPRQLLWDYAEAPRDERWRLQRIADFFPRFGRDRATVAALAAHLDRLHVPSETAELIRMYDAEWKARRHAADD